MWLEQLQNEIALQLDRGKSLASVEAELVDSADTLSDDEQAALWLFAWSYQGSEPHHTGRVPVGLVQ